jgi:hypothetical protein
MDEWREPYADEDLREEIEQLNQAQQAAAEAGCRLVSFYEYLWLPLLADMPEIEYQKREHYHAPYGDFAPAPDAPFHGAMWFTACPGAELPGILSQSQPWAAAEAVLDLHHRTVTIQAAEVGITFTGVNISLDGYSLLREINRELVRAKAAAYAWRITPQADPAPSASHLFPAGHIPILSNAHTRADVSGYALLEDRPHLHTLIYVGLAAHKTSVESLWASLIRGRGSCSLRGTSVLTDGEVKMLTQPLPEFNVLHAGIICRKALPGKWEAKDDAAYALAFAGHAESNLPALTLKRLQEALAFPLPEEWAATLWEYGLDTGYLQRLETGGDCLGGVRLDLTKDWQALVQGLLEQHILSL